MDDPASTIVYSGDTLITSRKDDSSERNKKMLAEIFYQSPQVADTINTYSTLPLVIEVQPDRELDKLLADLSIDTPRVIDKLQPKS